MYVVNPAMPWVSAITVLALLLLSGAVMHADVTRRRIPNVFCTAIAILALIHAVADSGWSGLGDIALRLAVAVVLAIPLCLLFAVRALGGGDVKLLLALVLWVDLAYLPNLFAVTVLAGALIAIGITAMRKVFCFRGPDGIPYGLAIVIGALFAVLPDLGVSAAAVCTRML